MQDEPYMAFLDMVALDLPKVVECILAWLKEGILLKPHNWSTNHALQPAGWTGG